MSFYTKNVSANADGETVNFQEVRPKYILPFLTLPTVEQFDEAWSVFENGGLVYIELGGDVIQATAYRDNTVDKFYAIFISGGVITKHIITKENGVITTSNESVSTITQQERNTVAKALVTPVSAPSEIELVGVNTNNAQVNITLGNGLKIENGELVGGITVLDTTKTYTWEELTEILKTFTTTTPVALQSETTVSLYGETINTLLIEMADVIPIEGTYMFLTKGATYETIVSGVPFHFSSVGGVWTFNGDVGGYVLQKLGTEIGGISGEGLCLRFRDFTELNEEFYQFMIGLTSKYYSFGVVNTSNNLELTLAKGKVFIYTTSGVAITDTQCGVHIDVDDVEHATLLLTHLSIGSGAGSNYIKNTTIKFINNNIETTVNNTNLIDYLDSFKFRVYYFG